MTLTRREKHINRLLRECRIALLVVDLDDVKLCSSRCAYGKGEELERVGCVGGLEVGKRSGMSLDRLGHTAIATVQLHCTFYSESTRRSIRSNANQYEPLFIL